ncbi:MAG TPA: TonB-dependent receptor [Niabella sp.]|nr:TonB-dependent receptor [Niabella sp.]HRB65694.1 TonB-dependent receptor [Niabella sp.]HRB74175.1 TonB-dependent receptor [Niabella sp.]HRC10191.1 TonB-dependent receptor [Niabella sp.]
MFLYLQMLSQNTYPLNHLKPLFLLIFFAFPAMKNLYAQITITGTVTDNLKKAIGGSNVLLLAAADSSLVKGTMSKTDGTFLLEANAPGSYLLAASYTGFNTNYSPVVIGNETTKYAGILVLQPVTVELQQVTVTAYKPMFEQKIDRMVVNVKNSITSTGGTVLDVLQRSPGVRVNKQNGVISMQGKEGVRVMINGKMSYIPADALVSMLGGMSANNVEKIELITTPPAKYDAGTNAGYINIILQQSPDEGFNASYSLSMGAFYGTKPEGNFDFNYRKNKSNLYGGYSINRLAQVQSVYNYRKITLQDKILESDGRSSRKFSQFNHNLNLGFDYDINKKLTLGLLATGYHNTWEMDAVNHTQIKTNGNTDTSIFIESYEINRWKNASFNGNLLYKPDNKSEISFDVNYVSTVNNNPTEYTSEYFNGTNSFLYLKELNSGKKTTIRSFPTQVDYKRNINKKLTLETGLKAESIQFTNDVLVEWLEPAGWQPDPDYTTIIHSKERIFGAYIQSVFSVNEKNSLQAGLRFEHTYTKLSSETEKNIVNRRYGNFFPTLFWSHKINDRNRFNVNYRRSIRRPAFSELAPFLYFFDPNTFLSGNSVLKPGISDKIGLDYIFRQFVLSVSYTHEADQISRFQASVDTLANKQYFISQNIDYVKTINASLTIPLAVTSWWTSNINISANQQYAKASYSQTPFRISLINTSLSGSQQFRLPNDFGIELSGWYQSKSLWGVQTFSGLGALNIAGQKKFSKSGSALTVGVDDVFSTGLRWILITDSPAEKFYSKGDWLISKRIFKITFSHRFGNSVLKQKRARSTAADDVNSRK